MENNLHNPPLNLYNRDSPFRTHWNRHKLGNPRHIDETLSTLSLLHPPPLFAPTQYKRSPELSVQCRSSRARYLGCLGRVRRDSVCAALGSGSAALHASSLTHALFSCPRDTASDRQLCASSCLCMTRCRVPTILDVQVSLLISQPSEGPE